MTTATHTTTARPRIMTGALLRVLLADFGALTTLYLLAAVVPGYTKAAGAGEVGAGASTAAMMMSGLVAELATPRLLARFGYRPVLAAGLVLLGAPALALTVATSLTAIMAICVLAGLGFGIMVVAAGALAAAVVPAERRGEGLGVYGAAVSLPGVIALPLGVWLAERAGYPVVFVAAGVAALAGLTALPGLRAPAPTSERPVGVLAGLRAPGLRRPALVFFATTTAGGIVVAFLPLAVAGEVGALALLAQSATATLTRWLAGRLGDRHGPAVLLVPGLVTAAAGMVTVALTASPVAVIAGMVLFGAGFGVTQNVTMAIMLNRMSPDEYPTANAVWSMAYDAGWGLGAAGFGVVATHTGFPAGFALTGVLMLTALVPARRDRSGH